MADGFFKWIGEVPGPSHSRLHEIHRHSICTCGALKWGHIYPGEWWVGLMGCIIITREVILKGGGGAD